MLIKLGVQMGQGHEQELGNNEGAKNKDGKRLFSPITAFRYERANAR